MFGLFVSQQQNAGSVIQPVHFVDLYQSLLSNSIELAENRINEHDFDKDIVVLDYIRKNLELYLIENKKNIILLYSGLFPQKEISDFSQLSKSENNYIETLIKRLIKSYIDEENVKFKEIFKKYYYEPRVGYFALKNPTTESEFQDQKNLMTIFHTVQKKLIAKHITQTFNEFISYIDELYGYYEPMESID